jgi:hypothetical protein
VQFSTKNIIFFQEIAFFDKGFDQKLFGPLFGGILHAFLMLEPLLEWGKFIVSG